MIDDLLLLTEQRYAGSASAVLYNFGLPLYNFGFLCNHPVSAMLSHPSSMRRGVLVS
jgi:hypothetical protein